MANPDELLRQDFESPKIEPLFRMRPTPLSRRVWRWLCGDPWAVTAREHLPLKDVIKEMRAAKPSIDRAPGPVQWRVSLRDPDK